MPKGRDPAAKTFLCKPDGVVGQGSSGKASCWDFCGQTVAVTLDVMMLDSIFSLVHTPE